MVLKEELQEINLFDREEPSYWNGLTISGNWEG
jgi:hypothetical protein